MPISTLQCFGQRRTQTAYIDYFEHVNAANLDSLESNCLLGGQCSEAPKIIESLTASPDLCTLVGAFPDGQDRGPDSRFRHPNLILLDILLGDVIDAGNMEWLLKSLKSLAIMNSPSDEQCLEWDDQWKAIMVLFIPSYSGKLNDCCSSC